MPIKAFPPISEADKHGLLAVGGDLEPESLLLAYRSGIFPWPVAEDILAWFAPPKRAVLYLDDFHVSRTLRKLLNRNERQVRRNTSFGEVIRACSAVVNRGKQHGTWITEAIIEAYENMHELGYAHSFETFHGTELVGGLYGILIGHYFSGESAFYREDNASKLAVCALVEWLREREVEWIDCQMMTPLFESFGAREIKRTEYMELLSRTYSRSEHSRRGGSEK